MILMSTCERFQQILEKAMAKQLVIPILSQIRASIALLPIFGQNFPPLFS